MGCCGPSFTALLVRARQNRRKSQYPFIHSLPMLYQAGENSAPTLGQTTGFLPANATGEGGHTGATQG
jgi:hypothetical protein